MKHSLKISVSDKPVSGGIVACRKVSLRKRVLDKLLGPEQKVTVIVPGTVCTASLTTFRRLPMLLPEMKQLQRKKPLLPHRKNRSSHLRKCGRSWRRKVTTVSPRRSVSFWKSTERRDCQKSTLPTMRHL